MRFVVYGAGSIGGLVGARLHQHGHDVTLIARGEHFRALERDGLRLVTPSGSTTSRIPVVAHPGAIDLGPDHVILLTMKGQDTAAAVTALREVAPDLDLPVACLQNGVENERVTSRHFSRVYGVPVMCPAGHLEPGVIYGYSEPVSGLLDVGRYPHGVDDVARELSAALAASTFDSHPIDDVMRWKWNKLLANVVNAVEALCGRGRFETAHLLARREAAACLRAAGIDVASPEEERERRGDLLRHGPIGDEPHPGGSSSQSLARGTGAIETDYLNGEIVLVGRLHGFPTPVNAVLQRLANEAARLGRPPGSMPEAELLAHLEAAGARIERP